MLALCVALGALACKEPRPPTDPVDTLCDLVVVTIYGDTAQFQNYTGPPPANLAAVRSWWWDCPPNQEPPR